MKASGAKNAPTLKTLNKNNVWDLQENDIFRLLDGIDRDSDQKDNLRHYTDIMRGAFSIEEITDEGTTIKAKYEKQGYKVGQIRLDEDTKIPQKRQRILDLYETMRKDTCPEYMDAVMKIARKLPKSSNSRSAFIAKYSYRSSEEIAHLILVSGAASEEHIKPQHRDKHDKGPDTNENKIVMCAACNSQRSKTSYKDWLLIHPEMIRNCQKYIDKIIDAIIDKKLVNYNDYPPKVKESLKIESGGKIDIDITKYEQYYENYFNTTNKH